MSEDAGFLSRWARRKTEVRSGRSVPVEPTAPGDVAVPVAPPASSRAVDSSVAADSTPSAADMTQAPALPEPPAPPAPTLEDVLALSPGDEVSRFVASGVDEGVKRAAVRKLFTDPHFNIMDGLDIYIDDYGQPDPIPLSMLRQMNQSRALGLFAAEEAAEAAEAAAAAARAEALAAPAAETSVEMPAEMLAEMPADGLAVSARAASADLPPTPPADEEEGSAASVAAPMPNPHEDPHLQLQPDPAAGRPGTATRAGAGGR